MDRPDQQQTGAEAQQRLANDHREPAVIEEGRQVDEERVSRWANRDQRQLSPPKLIDGFEIAARVGREADQRIVEVERSPREGEDAQKDDQAHRQRMKLEPGQQLAGVCGAQEEEQGNGHQVDRERHGGPNDPRRGGAVAASIAERAGVVTGREDGLPLPDLVSSRAVIDDIFERGIGRARQQPTIFEQRRRRAEPVAFTMGGVVG